MNEEQFKQLLAEAMAPIAERLTKLETPTAAPAAKPEAEPPKIEVAPVVDAATAEIQEMFAAAVVARFEAFVAQGKLVPEAREKFVAACGNTPAQLKAVAALYESAPAVVATTPAAIPAIKPKQTKEYSATALAWAERAKIDVSQLDKVQ